MGINSKTWRADAALHGGKHIGCKGLDIGDGEQRRSLKDLALVFRDSRFAENASRSYCGASFASAPRIRAFDPNLRKLLNVRSLRLSKSPLTFVTTCALTGRR